MSNPIGWSVKGNICPVELSAPVTGEEFTGTNGTVSVGDSVIIDGNPLIPVLTTPSGG